MATSEEIRDATLRLDSAVVAGDLQAARRALEDGADAQGPRPWERSQGLIRSAVLSGNVELCRLLKDKGSPIDIGLHLSEAVKNKQVEICRFFISECTPWIDCAKSGFNGSWGSFFADIGEKWLFEAAFEAAPDKNHLLHQPDSSWRTPLEHAVGTANIDLCRFMMGQGARPDAGAFVRAAIHGPDFIELFLEAGLHPDATAMSGANAFQTACITGNAPSVNLLLDAGASLELCCQGETALLLAAHRPNIMALLKAKGADMQAVNNSKENVLMRSLKSGLPNFVLACELLNDLPELFPGRDEKGRTLAHFIAQVNLNNLIGLDPLKVLLQPRIKRLINEPDNSGDTPLFRAIDGQEKLVMIDALLRAGADPNAMNKNGETPLFKAATIGSARLCKALLAGGAEVNTVCHGGQTALDAAIIMDKDALLPLFIAEGAVPHSIDLKHLPGDKKRSSVLGDPPLLAAIKTDDADYLKGHLSRNPNPPPGDVKAAQTFIRRCKKSNVSALFSSWMAQRAVNDVLGALGPAPSIP